MMQVPGTEGAKAGVRLFHVSEQPGITIFHPRPSPSFFSQISGDVVFAISETMLHNYLLPRDCPRVAWYATDQTTGADKNTWMNNTDADYVIAVESGWYERVRDAVLYCYEFDARRFILLDACAGYYISYEPVVPVAVVCVEDVLTQLLIRKVELRFTPSLLKLADAIRKSSVNFSIIRMRNAKS